MPARPRRRAASRAGLGWTGTAQKLLVAYGGRLVRWRLKAPRAAHTHTPIYTHHTHARITRARASTHTDTQTRWWAGACVRGCVRG